MNNQRRFDFAKGLVIGLIIGATVGATIFSEAGPCDSVQSIWTSPEGIFTWGRVVQPQSEPDPRVFGAYGRTHTDQFFDGR